jgi:serine/threonine-protein kinase/endoribonuclease IRE1
VIVQTATAINRKNDHIYARRKQQREERRRGVKDVDNVYSDARAIEEYAPGGLDRAVVASSVRESGQGIAPDDVLSQQFARSLTTDFESDDIVLFATVDGTLYAGVQVPEKYEEQLRQIYNERAIERISTGKVQLTISDHAENAPRGIDPPTTREKETHNATRPLDPRPSVLDQVKSLPSTAANSAVDLVYNPLTSLIIITVLFWKQKEIMAYFGTLFQRVMKQFAIKHGRGDPIKSWEDVNINEIESTDTQTPKADDDVKVDEVDVAKNDEVDFRDIPAPLQEDEPAPLPVISEVIEPTSDSSDERDQEQDRETVVTEPDAASPQALNEPLQDTVDTNVQEKYPPGWRPEKTAPPKKAHRGKRAGKRHRKKGRGEGSEVSSDGGVINQPVTVDEAVRDAKLLGQTRAIEPDVQTLSHGMTEVSGPVIRINELQVNMDKHIGTGSNGTMVFEGELSGRKVAVKRMLIQFFEIADQETKLLAESDNHPNVVRYYIQQESQGFLYIALELCEASLAHVIEKPHLHRALAQAGERDIHSVLYQIAKGLKHLHDLRIVHRDLKPQNILVSMGNDGKPRLLVSDFGLCKKLEGEQSSFRATTAHAAGTSGWRAPELLLDDDIRDGSKTALESINSEQHSSSDTGLVSQDVLPSRRATRAIDIFSLGLVFFYVLTKGSHPFDRGDRYMREVNIRKGDYSLEPLQVLGEEAHDAERLIASMIDSNPKMRPSASEVMTHPFFWTKKMRLSFLCDVSDAFEKEIRDPPSPALQELEALAPEVINGDFQKALPQAFIDSLGKQRKYTGTKLLDLLRALRNKKNHYEDMPEALQKTVGSLPEGYLAFWTTRFPKLLLGSWELVWDLGWSNTDRFRDYYELNPTR